MTEKSSIGCPGCGAAFEIDPSLLGRKLQCDVCEMKFVVEEPDEGRLVSLVVICEGCGEEQYVPSPGLEANHTCNSCGATFKVPVSSSSASHERHQQSTGGSEDQSVVWSNARHKPSEVHVFEAAPSVTLGALKDPLQTTATPYDVLGVARDADRDEVEKAFRVAFANKGAVQERKRLIDPVKRAEADLTIYNEVALRRLAPSPLEDPEALYPQRRHETAQQWEKQFKDHFPDPGIAHSLAVFWYWWVEHEELRFMTAVRTAVQAGIRLDGGTSRHRVVRLICKANGIDCDGRGHAGCVHTDCPFRDGCGDVIPPMEEMWKHAIRYWSMLEAMPDFWETYLGVSKSDGQTIGKEFVDGLAQRILDLSTEYATLVDTAHGDDGPAIDEIEGLDSSVVKALKQEGYHTARDVLRAGVLRLTALEGLSGALASALYTAVRNAMGDTDGLHERYRALAAMLETERRTANAICKAKIRTKRGQVCCGALMLRQMGLIDDVKGKVDTALESNASDKRLQLLSSVLSAHYDIVLLLESGRPSEALEAIARLPEEEQHDEDVIRLRVRALHLLAKEEASLGQLEDALDTWQEILAEPACAPMKGDMVSDIAEVCHKRALALQKNRRDEAIGILQTALPLTHDEKLKLLLAEMLTQRGIDSFMKGQKAVENCMPPSVVSARQRANAAAARQDWTTAVQALREALRAGDGEGHEEADKARREGIGLCDKGLADIESGAKLGYKRAKDQLEPARGAIDLMKTPWQDVIRKNLAASLTNLAINRVNESQKSDNPFLAVQISPAVVASALRESEQDLLEAQALDPDSDHIRKSLKTCREMLLQFGKGPASLARDRRPAARPPSAQKGKRPAARSAAQPGQQASSTSGLAVASLVLALCSFGLGLLTAIPAAICGHKALSQISSSGGRKSGQGMASWGLAIAYIVIGVHVLMLIASAS